MKKTLCLLVVLFFLSCEEVIEIETPTATPRLVIDASFSLFLLENNPSVEGGVKLSMSSNFFKEISLVHDATVFLTYTSNGFKLPFKEIKNTGVYIPIDNTIILDPPSFDEIVELTVIHDSNTYKATTSLVPTVPINNVKQGEGNLFDDETEIIISFTDNPTRKDYYLFDLDFNLFLTSEDKFYQGQQFSFSYFYDDIEAGRIADIKLLGVDKQFYDYMRLIIEQSGIEGNSPFNAPPANIRGNIVNTTNAELYPLGYFSISEAYLYSFTIIE